MHMLLQLAFNRTLILLRLVGTRVCRTAMPAEASIGAMTHFIHAADCCNTKYTTAMFQTIPSQAMCSDQRHVAWHASPLTQASLRAKLMQGK